MVERLCIYLTYNRENKIYDYIGRVLQSLKECGVKICLVCNYDHIAEGQDYAEAYAEQIFYRENRGYDSGAYKDTLRDYLGWDEVGKYDEILLINDSFFGFFYPIEDTFRLMEQADCDFWGITGQEAGEYSNPTHVFESHVHSYFMAFKRKVVESEVFRHFWEELEYPRNFREAIVCFELGINERLKKNGFRGKSYIDLYQIRLKRNENPCYSMSYELVSRYGMPLFKKKGVLIRNTGFAYTLKTLDYLKEKALYPMEWITCYLENQFYIPGIGENVCNSLEIFCQRYTDVYIYGAGVCGKNLAVYFTYKGWKYKGHIVTDKEKADIPSFDIEEAEIDSDTGIIISVIDPVITGEIAEHIGGRCSREQLFFISDCAAIRLPR